MSRANSFANYFLFLCPLFIFLFFPGCRQSPLEVQPPPLDKHQPYEYVGKQAMVVAAHPLAVEAGLKILKSGGNAIDAAIATAVALNAAEPFASGIGGGGFMIIYLAKSGQVRVINFREKASRSAYPRMFAEKGEAAATWRTTKGTAVAVPGALAGWSLALKRYGTKTLEEVFQPAIEVAEKGFPVSETFSNINKEEYEKLLANAGEETVYLNRGLPYEPGDYFRNPELAQTLRRIGKEGIEVFYRGEIAAKIVRAVQEREGGMTLEDLASYQPLDVEPVHGKYKGRDIFTIPPPGSGLFLLELLHIAANWPIHAWGRDSSLYLHHLSEAMRLVFADREAFLGDPEFVHVPGKRLLSPELARDKAKLVQTNRVLGNYFPEKLAKEKNSGNTTHLCVVDPAGNAVSLTQSINLFFGSGIVPEGTGFILNNHMNDFATGDTGPNIPYPGRRPASSMAPLLMFENGRLWLILGSPGGTRIFPTLSEIIINLVDFGLSLDAAIEAPRFFSYSQGGVARPLSLEPRFSAATIKGLEAIGHKITLRQPFDTYFGGAQGIIIDRAKGLILGGADSRRDGFGKGY